MSLCIINNITKHKSTKLVNVIYKNFIELAPYEDLKHNRGEIQRCITSENGILCLIVVNEKIATYLLGEVMDLNDGRKVFYIAYMFTARKFRKKGYASQLMEYVENYAREMKCNGIMLTCDTEDPKIYDYYKMRGYMEDVVLRKYDTHDVMYKAI